MTSRENTADVAHDEWQVTLGRYKDGLGYREALTAAGMHVEGWAADLLEHRDFHCAQPGRTIALVAVSENDLGIRRGAAYQEIIKNAAQLGLAICPAEAGPALRLIYREQRENEWLIVGMKPLIDAEGDPHVFCLERDGDELWLFAGGLPDHFWRRKYRFIFARSASG